jgi:hypothetical protein
MEESGSVGLDELIKKESNAEASWFKGVDAVCIVRIFIGVRSFRLLCMLIIACI